SSPVVYTLSTTAPTLSESLAFDTGASALDHITSNDALSGTGLANTVVHFTIDGSAIATTVTANPQGNWSFTPSGLADGAHTIVQPNGSWSTSVTLSNGSNSLTAQVSHLAGNPATSSPVVYTLGQFTIQWISQIGGNWSTASNWDTGALPGPQDDVLINPAVNVIFNTGSSTINQLTTGASTALTIAGGTMVIAATSNIGGLLAISAGTLTPNGSITVGGLSQS